MKKAVHLFAGAALLLAAGIGCGGCALFLVGAGAAGGYAISRDSVISQHDLSTDRVYQESLAVVKKMGLVTLEDAKHARIEAMVQETKIVVTVKPLTKRTVELRVKGRKNLMPAVAAAQEVHNKIAERL